MTQYKNDPIVCPQPPQDPCPNGRGSLDVVHKKPNLNLPDSDVYFVGWNFSEYNNKNITVKLSQVNYRFIKLDAGGACIWSSEPRSVYGLTFSAKVVNNGFTVGHDLNVPDRPAGSKVEILDFVRRSGDQSVILVDGEIPACVDKGTVKDHIPCPEPSTQCTPNTLTLKYTSRGRQDAGCTVSANTITYSIEAERPVDDNVTVQLKYYKQHFNRDGSDAGIEDIYENLTISKGSKTSSSVTEIQNICPAGSIAGCITDSCYNAYGVNRIFGAEISHIASFSNSDCYPLIGGTDATCPSLSVATPMDVTSQCCKEWGESAVNNVSPSIGIKDKCCQYPDIKEDWSICSGNTCSYTSFDGPEDGCCLTAPSHNDAWYSGCCSTDTTDDDCCTAKVNKDGLKPGDFCCSSNKYKNDPRCQTPCDKVQKGTATEADKKACCQDENNSIWTTNKAWADACCALTEDNGNYSYKDDNSKAAMCCSAWVDSQMIKYNPSEYNSSDGKSGGCPRFDKTCIYQNFSGSVEACTLSCSTNGSPNKEYVNKYCCNEWKSGSKLQQGTELFNQCCSLLQNDDNVWKDFCTPQEQTCPPISEANADNASAKCCSEWMPIMLALNAVVNGCPRCQMVE